MLGALGLGISAFGLARDIGFIAQPFYAWAWWSWILLLDGIAASLRGSSLLTDRRRGGPALCLWSVSFWYFFELLNLRFQNWYYVGVPAAYTWLDLAGGALFGVACFATVFLGIFEMYDVLAAAGLFRSLRVRPGRIPAATGAALQLLGVMMVVLAVGFPYWLAPLVWGSLGFLVDPWNRRHGGRSLLRDLELGEAGSLPRLLVAGLACGLVWESLNFVAPQKWIYTVRGLEDLKLFEMPVLGFLGFPALALDAFAAYAAIARLFHGGATWEHPEDVPEPPAPARPRRRLFLALLPAHLALWAGVSYAVQFFNIGSVELSLSQLHTLPRGAIDRLAAEGIRRPGQLLAGLEEPERAARLTPLLGLDERGHQALVDELRLLTLKGIGVHHGRSLHAVGVRCIGDLARADPAALFDSLEAQRKGRVFPALRPEMVRVWVSAARRACAAGCPCQDPTSRPPKS